MLLFSIEDKIVSTDMAFEFNLNYIHYDIHVHDISQ